MSRWSRTTTIELTSHFRDTVQYEWNLKDVLDFNKHAGNSRPNQNTPTLFYNS